MSGVVHSPSAHTQPVADTPVVSGHTPGPWAVNVTDDTLVCAGRTSIASAYPIRDDWNEAEANARLIAAAPDLLEALNPLTSADEATAAHFATLDPDETVAINIPVRCILRADAAKRKATTAAEAGSVGVAEGDEP